MNANEVGGINTYQQKWSSKKYHYVASCNNIEVSIQSVLRLSVHQGGDGWLDKSKDISGEAG